MADVHKPAPAAPLVPLDFSRLHDPAPSDSQAAKILPKGSGSSETKPHADGRHGSKEDREKHGGAAKASIHEPGAPKAAAHHQVMTSSAVETVPLA
jgi:hypothetical protein